MLFAVILAPGQSAEFSGGYVFFLEVLDMVTAYAKMNESDVSLRWGKASLDIYLNVYNGGVRCTVRRWQ